MTDAPRTLSKLGWMFALALIVGCGTQTPVDTPEAATPSAAVPSPGPTASAPAGADATPAALVTQIAKRTAQAQQASEASISETPDEADKVSQPAATSFTPPFPDRTELFAPPKRPSLDAIARNNTASQSELELKGFVHVDKPRAVLLIEGQIATLAVGDERNGVQVVSIAPPQITLQRGRERWTESLMQPR